MSALSKRSASKGSNKNCLCPKRSTIHTFCSDGKYYTGRSDDADSRFERHKRGRAAKFTWRNKPVKIVWKQEFETELEAIRREEQIKGWTREKKEKLIRGEWN